MLQLAGKTLNSVLDKLGLGRRIRSYFAFQLWGKVVGEPIARNTKIERIVKDTLYISTTSPVWAQELSALKPIILEKLNAAIGTAAIKDIKFSSKLQAKEVPTTEYETPLSHSSLPETVNQSQQELPAEWLKEVATALPNIGDEKLKAAFNKLLVAWYKLKVK